MHDKISHTHGLNLSFYPLPQHRRGFAKLHEGGRCPGERYSRCKQSASTTPSLRGGNVCTIFLPSAGPHTGETAASQKKQSAFDLHFNPTTPAAGYTSTNTELLVSTRSCHSSLFYHMYSRMCVSSRLYWERSSHGRTVSAKVSGSHPCASTSVTMPRMYAKTSSSSSFTAPSASFTTDSTDVSFGDIPRCADVW